MTTQQTNNDPKRLGGYLKEKWTIGMSRISSDECVRAIVKVTSHKLKIPNEKHLARLIAATHGNFNPGNNTYDDINGWIVSELEPHTHSRNWIVVLKTLIVYHTLLNEGSDEIVLKISQHRAPFNTTHMKDLADSPDGALQEGFIQAYARYLEERCVTIASCRLQNRLESLEFEHHFGDVSPETAAPIASALLLQLEVMLNVEFRKEALNNHATLHAFKLVLRDGKRLYVVLTKRIMKMLDEFTSYSSRDKRTWVNLFKRYQAASQKLATIFDQINSNTSIEFGESFPRLQIMPAGIVVQLENALLDDEVTITKLDRSALPTVEPSAVEQEVNRGGRGSPDLFKKRPSAPAPAAAVGASAAGATAAMSPASNAASTSATTPAVASPAMNPAVPQSVAAPVPKKADPFDNLFGASSSSTAPSVSSPQNAVPQQQQQPRVSQPPPQQPPLFNTQPQAATLPAPEPVKTGDVFTTLFDGGSSTTSTGGTRSRASPPPSSSAPAAAAEFDPFAAVAQAPQWQSAPSQQQQQQQPSSQAPPGKIDFFASGTGPGAQQQQSRQRSAMTTEGGSVAEQQLDFFADAQQGKKRAW